LTLAESGVVALLVRRRTCDL